MLEVDKFNRYEKIVFYFVIMEAKTMTLSRMTKLWNKCHSLKKIKLFLGKII